ncbi:hypothetical protein FOZ60_007321 [Perkinsus olseni]|uniref:Uncharacterized protein n=1 Tax=Perkinsus olseni TaxID=32597 RepID=A0A7J6NLN7_PEROL|nr:hypothetical protein FOZ60_007321 [Perkinsus olseni]
MKEMPCFEVAIILFSAAQIEGRLFKAVHHRAARPRATRTGDERHIKSHLDCVLETSDFKGFRTSKLESIIEPWQASVAGKFDKKKGKYVIDYATLGETILKGNESHEQEDAANAFELEDDEWVLVEEQSKRVHLQWFPSPGSLPIAGVLNRIGGGESCEEAIIQWGKMVLKELETTGITLTEIPDIKGMNKLMSEHPETFAPLVIAWILRRDFEEAMVYDEEEIHPWQIWTYLKGIPGYVTGSAYWSYRSACAVIGSIEFESNEQMNIPLKRESIDFVRDEVAAATAGELSKFKNKDKTLTTFGASWVSPHKLSKALDIAREWKLK